MPDRFDDDWSPDGSSWEPTEYPREFYSEYHEAPFPRCVDCDRDLPGSDEVYSVIKSYVAGETVFEMAICADCSMRLAESYSAKSRQAFEARIRDWKERQAAARAATDNENAPNREPVDADWSPADTLRLEAGAVENLKRCAGCGRSREECHRYAIIGAFWGDRLVSAPAAHVHLPLLVCDHCNSQASENISQQTRDTWDRFVESHFDGPPGIELDMPKVDPVML
ncbi:MAG: hypothetical protein R3B90_20265 [Planctomycetaceae bacterium]